MLLFGMWTAFGAITAWAAQQLVIFLEFFIVKHILRIPIWEQIKAFFAPVVASLVMVAFLLLINMTIGHKVTDFIMLLILVPSGALIYLSLIYVLKPNLPKLIISLLQKRKSSVPT
jgi:hypothetical protein